MVSRSTISVGVVVLVVGVTASASASGRATIRHYQASPMAATMFSGGSGHGAAARAKLSSFAAAARRSEYTKVRRTYVHAPLMTAKGAADKARSEQGLNTSGARVIRAP